MRKPMGIARFARGGRVNPGTHHIAGADITPKEQRQYEDILQSLRHYHRFSTDAKRKQVAAATVRKMAKNPGALRNLMRNLGIDDQGDAERMSEAFHGRPVEEIIEVEERRNYDQYGAVLGYLVELAILADDDRSVFPIRFSDDVPEYDEDTVLLVSNSAGTNLEFVGGDQSIDWQRVEGARQQDKYLIAVGPVHSVTYFTDKHHLSGPKSQKYGTPYEHEFGDEGGELPFLVYDRPNVHLMLVGGDYSIAPDGIAG